MFNGTITIRPDGEVIFHGYDEPNSTLHYRQANGIIVTKTKGGTYWRGVGADRGYSGAFFRVLRIDETQPQHRPKIDEYSNEVMRVNTIVEFPVRNK